MNILLLTDFSELSTFAKDLARKIAFNLNAQLHVMYVVQTSSEVLLDAEGNIKSGMGADVQDLLKEKEAALEEMQKWKADLPGSAESHVVFGDLHSSIKKEIKNHAIDLVIMGTHGVTGMAEKLSGSVTQEVILENRVPVLSVKCDRGAIDFTDFLIAGDFESDKEMNLDLYKQLQKVFKSNIHLLWVNTKSKFTSTAKALKRMTAFAELNQLENISYHIHNDNSVEEGIMNFTNNYDANHDLDIDIIAVEKKNKSTLEYWFTGCDAVNYVNHIYRPIVTYLTK